MGKAVVEVNSKDVEGDTPLHVMLWRDDNYGAKCLIEAGAEIDAVGDMSETPLHIAVRKNNIEVAELLLSKGADPDIVSEFGMTPRAAAADQSREMRQLFK